MSRTGSQSEFIILVSGPHFALEIRDLNSIWRIDFLFRRYVNYKRENSIGEISFTRNQFISTCEEKIRAKTQPLRFIGFYVRWILITLLLTIPTAFEAYTYRVDPSAYWNDPRALGAKMGVILLIFGVLFFGSFFWEYYKVIKVLRMLCQEFNTLDHEIKWSLKKSLKVVRNDEEDQRKLNVVRKDDSAI